MTKEALPSDFENGWIRSVGLFGVRFGIPTDDGVAGVEVWISLDVAIIHIPMVPRQNSSTPKNIKSKTTTLMQFGFLNCKIHLPHSQLAV